MLMSWDRPCLRSVFFYLASVRSAAGFPTPGSGFFPYLASSRHLSLWLRGLGHLAGRSSGAGPCGTGTCWFHSLSGRNLVSFILQGQMASRRRDSSLSDSLPANEQDETQDGRLPGFTLVMTSMAIMAASIVGMSRLEE